MFLKHLNLITLFVCFSISVFNDSTLWITGGEDGAKSLKSTEFVFVNQPAIEGPDLPFAINGHCMVQTDSNTIFIVGGSISESKSSPAHSKLENNFIFFHFF